ncbi:MAG: UvrD-helicase domain-containing protein [Myxococcota bacterium]
MNRWTDEQLACFALLAETDRNVLIEALAGAGKTSTIVEMGRRFRALRGKESAQILYLAFNRRVREELEAKVADFATAKTFHAYGLRIVRERWPDAAGIKQNLVTSHVKAHHGTLGDLAFDIERGLSWVMSNGIKPDEFARVKNAALGQFVNDAEAEPRKLHEAAHLAYELLNEMVTRKWVVKYGLSFELCCYLPYLYGWTPRGSEPELGFIDEIQDADTPQAYLALSCAKRLVFVGDRYQAIYQWRGANEGIIDFVKDKSSAVEARLTGSFRCGERVAVETRRFVSSFRTLKSESGSIVYASQSQLLMQVQPGEAVISRSNAPLFRLWVLLLKQGTPAHFLGKKLADRTAQILRATRDKDLGSACLSATRILTNRLQRQDAVGADTKQDQDLLETIAAIRDAFGAAMGVESFIGKLQSSSANERKDSGVVLTTVHQAKGFEWTRVWLISDTFLDSEESPFDEEWNIKYVALTRAALHIVFVEEDTDVPSRPQHQSPERPLSRRTRVRAPLPAPAPPRASASTEPHRLALSAPSSRISSPAQLPSTSASTARPHPALRAPSSSTSSLRPSVSAQLPRASAFTEPHRPALPAPSSGTSSSTSPSHAPASTEPHRPALLAPSLRSSNAEHSPLPKAMGDASRAAQALQAPTTVMAQPPRAKAGPRPSSMKAATLQQRIASAIQMISLVAILISVAAAAVAMILAVCLLVFGAWF